MLALVAGQDVEEGDEPGSWRIARKVTYERVFSTVYPETRHMHKSRSEYRDGFKAHLAIEPGSLNSSVHRFLTISRESRLT